MISIIVPLYNAINYIESCVSDILQQTYKDFEIILVDDGSTDGSNTKCDEIADMDKRIKVIHTENGGPATARRIGIEHSLGEYLMFIDIDDTQPGEAIEKLVAEFDEHTDIVCGYLARTSEGKALENDCKQEEKLVFDEPLDALKDFFTVKNLNSSLCGKLIRRELFEGINFGDNTTVGDDINLIIQLYIKSKRTILLPLTVYYYRYSADGISHSGYNSRHHESLLYYISFSNKMADAYPLLKAEIMAYFLEHEMSVMTAMCRNKTYVKEDICILKKEIKANKKYLYRNKYTPFYYKFSAFLIAINYRLFAVMFNMTRFITGR